MSRRQARLAELELEEEEDRASTDSDDEDEVRPGPSDETPPVDPTAQGYFMMGGTTQPTCVSETWKCTVYVTIIF